MAVLALGNIVDARAVDPLIKAHGDEDSDVREKAAEALGKIGSCAVEPLIRVLGDRDAAVRLHAAWALNELHWYPTNESEKGYYLIAKKEWDKAVLLGNPVVELLIRALVDSDVYVRKDAAEALEKIGDVRAVGPLIRRLGIILIGSERTRPGH